MNKRLSHDELEAWSEAWMRSALRAQNRWRFVASWAFKYSGKTMPKRRRLVLKLAELAVRAESQRVLIRYWLNMPCPT
jgi:hypothetical protein